jgi:hypothetical protein
VGGDRLSQQRLQGTDALSGNHRSMSVFTNFLEKLGSDFLKSAMVPSIALVAGSIFVFNPSFVVNTFIDSQATHQLISLGTIVFVFTVIIGLTLTSLNTVILMMFEGYIIYPPLRFLYSRSRNLLTSPKSPQSNA